MIVPAINLRGIQQHPADTRSRRDGHGAHGAWPSSRPQKLELACWKMLEIWGLVMIYIDFYGFMNVFDDFVGTYPGHICSVYISRRWVHNFFHWKIQSRKESAHKVKAADSAYKRDSMYIHLQRSHRSAVTIRAGWSWIPRTMGPLGPLGMDGYESNMG